MTVTCSACGYDKNPDGTEFCDACGSEILTAPTPPAPPAPRPSTKTEVSEPLDSSPYDSEPYNIPQPASPVASVPDPIVPDYEPPFTPPPAPPAPAPAPFETASPFPIGSGSARLKVKQVGAPVSEFLIDNGSAIVGIFDPDTGPVDVDLEGFQGHETVSRSHAEIYQEGSVWKIKDLGSTNGVFIKPVGQSRFDSRITMPTAINPGDEIAIAKVRLLFQDA